MMSAENTKIAIITYQFSVVVKSIENVLKKKEYDVVTLNDNVEELKKCMFDTGIFVLYLPDDVLDDKKKVSNLLLISDTLKDNSKSLILIGSDKNHDDCLKSVPTFSSYPWVDRPIDMNNFISLVEEQENKMNEAQALKKILVIDDDPFFAKMVSGWLKGLYDVTTAEGGMQGITYLTRNKIDLILLDYEMPVVDGPKILEMLRADEETKDIPVIFLTGIGTKESIARVMGLKPQGYILKTASREELISDLIAFFDKQKALS